MDDLVLRAMRLAERAHRENNHFRKAPDGLDRPAYFLHLAEVAWILQEGGLPDEVVAAGYLHDTLEDCGYTQQQARLESIQSGKWDRYFPKPVKIPVLSFMEKDLEGTSHWFDVTKGQWIQGLIAQQGEEVRLYVVTIHPEMENAVHERWPRVMAG